MYFRNDISLLQIIAHNYNFYYNYCNFIKRNFHRRSPGSRHDSQVERRNRVRQEKIHRSDHLVISTINKLSSFSVRIVEVTPKKLQKITRKAHFV
jgi:hypothetical protein